MKDTPSTLKAIEDFLNIFDRIKDMPTEPQTLVKYTLLDDLNTFPQFIPSVTL